MERVPKPKIEVPQTEEHEVIQTEDKSSLDNSAYLEASLNRHWLEIIQDHIDEFSEEDKGILDMVTTNLREGKRPIAHLSEEKKARFWRSRNQLWKKIFGISFVKWNNMQESAHAKEKISKQQVATGTEPKDNNAIKNKKNEGESIGVEERPEIASESPEISVTEIEPAKTYRSWEELVEQARTEFPENIRGLLDKRSQTKKLSAKERKLLRGFIVDWFYKTFGIKLKKDPQIASKIKEEPPLGEKISDRKTLEIEDGNIRIEPEIEEGSNKERTEPEETSEIYRDLKKRILMRSVLFENRAELPEKLLSLLDKISSGLALEPEEQSEFDILSSKWFRSKFGIEFRQYNKPKREQQNKEVERHEAPMEITPQRQQELDDQKTKRLEELGDQKRRRMEQLHQAIKNLDNREPVQEFADETRRIVYFDEDQQRYFVEEGGTRKNLGIGDITSDYAWGIKYVPGGEMIEPAYRIVAKRILANETRRELEKIHDKELIALGLASGPFQISLEKLENKKKIGAQQAGGLAEVEIRELLTRLSLNYGDLNFVVSRVDAQEDTRDKYDFKIRVKRRVRGVKVDPQKINSVGFQLKSKISKQIPSSVIYRQGQARLVDEVIKLSVPNRVLGEVVIKWFKANRPSGGPEQFLPRDLKVKILKIVTKELVKISNEEIEKIFPA